MFWIAQLPTTTTFFGRAPGIVSVFIIILAVLVINAVLHYIFALLSRRAEAAHHIWRDAVLSSISAPLQGILWMIALSISVRILLYEDTSGRLSLLGTIFPPVRDVAVIALITWFLLRMVWRVQSNMQLRAQAKGHELDPTLMDAMGKLISAAIVITAALVAMQSLGFSISGLLAFGGIGGIAIGFAAQGLVANLFGGLTVYASRPFKVGDWIILPETNFMGQVQHIGWRATRIMGFDRKPFYVPNAMFNTAVVVNQSRMTNRRIQEHVHVRLRDVQKIPAIIAEGNKMIGEHPGIDHSFFVFRFDTCGDYSLKLLVYAFTLSTDYSEYMRVKEEILLKIAQIVHDQGGELAAPVSTIYAPEGVQLHGPAVEPAIAGLLEDSPQQ